MHWGRKVLEVRPPGRASTRVGGGVEFLLDGTDITAALYVGDDKTDLDALRGPAQGGGRRARSQAAVCVGVALRRDAAELEGPRPTCFVDGPVGVRALLVRVGRLVTGGALRRPAQDDGHAQRGLRRRWLAVVTVIGRATHDHDDTLVLIARAGWWIAGAIIGAALGRGARR